MPKLKRFIPDYRVLRAKLRLSQHAFWGRLGVKQSSGCRYEEPGYDIPRPVELLAYSVYVDGNPIDSKDFK